MFKMLVTDLDGTLLNNQHVVSNENIYSIKKIKEKGILFCVATGRPLSSVKKLLEENAIEKYVDFLITFNGVNYYDCINKVNFNMNFLGKDTIKTIYNKYKKYDISFVVHDEDTIYCNQINEGTKLESGLNQYKTTIVENFEEILNKNYPKLMLIASKEVLNTIQKDFEKNKNQEYNFFRSNTEFFEVVSQNVSKGFMLQKLCKEQNINIEKVVSIGDNLNDLDMIQISGFGVTLENGSSELKKHAKLITKSNEENGFSELCQYILENID